MRLATHGIIVILALSTLSGISYAQAPEFPFPDGPTTEVPTNSPVASTPEPTAAPVMATADPTMSPVDPVVTDQPTPNPTDVPTIAPVAAPVAATAAPTKSPTDPPTQAPVSDAPTLSPVAAPTTELPTATPTVNPTMAPVVAPVTAVPTVAPTTAAPTTDAPTAAAPTTDAPTVPQTAAPTTAAPTSAGTAPTTSPEAGPTASPTGAPTPAATFALWGPEAIKGLSIDLTGAGDMTTSAQEAFNDAYKEHSEGFFGGTEAPIQNEVTAYETTVNYVSSESVARRVLASLGLRRRLQTDKIRITYNQVLEYRAAPDMPLNRVIEAPLKTRDRRNAFRDLLVASGDPAYADLPAQDAVSAVYPPADVEPEAKSNTTTIIIAVCASVGGLLVLGGGFLLYKRRSASKSGFGSSLNDDDAKPPSQLQLSTVGANDEVSMLEEPTPKLGVQSGESLAGYGDQSVATVDYDYSKAYGGGGEASVVSSVGGTLGSQTRGGVTTQSGAAGLAATGAGASIFSDDNSFEQNYGQNISVKEEMIEVYAPPGKLGVVIDTPDEGAPVVHAIKDSSCIADQLKVGDKLIAVDDEDVRAMTAIKVSKMISRKSANPTRKLTVVRTSVTD